MCFSGRDVLGGQPMDEHFNKKPTWREETLAFADTTYKVDIANTQFDSENGQEGGGRKWGGKKKVPSGPSVNWHVHY